MNNNEIFISFDRAKSHKIPFPQVGFCRLSRMEQLSKEEIRSMAHLNFSFYTILLNLSGFGWQDIFKMANNEAKGLKVPMQVLLQFGSEVENELREFIELCQTVFPFIEEVIILQNNNKVTPPGLLHQILPILREGLHHVKIGIGSYTALDALKEHKPDLTDADFLSLPFQNGISPDSSRETKNETLHQIELIHSLKSAYFPKHIYVIPLSLNSGWFHLSQNGVAFFKNDEQLMPLLDVSGRAISNFKSLIFSGADSISVYENGGRSEVFSANQSEIKFEKITTVPFFYLLNEVLEMNNGFIIQAENNSPSLVDVLILIAGTKIKVMLINLSREKQIISLGGISIHAKIRIVDSESIKEILNQPDESRVMTGKEISYHNAMANIVLPPLGIGLIQE